MRTEDVFKKILIKCLLSAGKAGIMMCLEIKAIKHLPTLLEAGHGNEAITRPLPASSQPLGGGERMCLAERAECPETPLPTCHDSLTSKHSIKPLMSHHIWPPGAQLRLGQANDWTDPKCPRHPIPTLTSSPAWQDLSAPFKPQCTVRIEARSGSQRGQ